MQRRNRFLLLVAMSRRKFFEILFASLVLGWVVAYGSDATKTRLSDGTVVSVTHGRCSNCDLPYQLDRIGFTFGNDWWGSGTFMPKDNGAGASTILHTVDRGKHWDQLPFSKSRSGEEAPAFFFLDPLHGWVSSFDSWNAQGTLSWTVDGGKSWKRTPSGAISQLQFIDSLHGYLAGTALSGGFFGATSDGGVTWARTELPLSQVDAMSFTGHSDGILVGTQNTEKGPVPDVLVTRDGGLSWEQSRLPDGLGSARIHDFVRPSALTAYLSVWLSDQQGSELLESLDGGKTWQRLVADFVGVTGKYILAVAFTPSGRGYVFYSDQATRSNFVALSTNGNGAWKSEWFPLAVTTCIGLETTIVCSSKMDTVILTESVVGSSH